MLYEVITITKKYYDCVAYQYKPNHFVVTFLDITDVITSYSIHYTKLYENLLMKLISQAQTLREQFCFLHPGDC